MGPFGVGILYSQSRALLRMASRASRKERDTSLSALTMCAASVPPAVAILFRLEAAFASELAKMPTTYVRMDGVSAKAFAAIAATPPMSLGAQDVGRPSVASTTATAWPGASFVRVRA